MALQTIPLEHIPSTHVAHVALFRDVRNASFLHSQLLSHNPEFEYAFIDASVIVSMAQVHSAVFRAVTALLARRLKTPNVHSEIVASLAMSNNISEAYRRFGMGPATKDILVVKVTFPPTGDGDAGNSDGGTPDPPAPAEARADGIRAHLAQNVEGEAVALSEDTLAGVADWPKVRRYYKLNGLAWLDGLSEQHRRRETEIIILGSMALRGV